MANNETNEQNVQRSIEETGGIPEIELSMEVSGMTQYPVDKTLSVPDMAADAKETGDAIADANSAIAENAGDIAAIQAWTGEDIPISSLPDAPTIAEAVADITTSSYPVGSIYMTTSPAAPTFSGTWVEVGITATWTQLKNGKRDYTALESGNTGGTVHFWLRTA